MTGAELIAAERERQIEGLGRTSEHDDQHEQCELIHAAESYLLAASYVVEKGPHAASKMRGMPPRFWPWEDDAWNPNRKAVRNLVKAGALIAAEIDRLERAGIE